MNALDRFFTLDPQEFASRYIEHLSKVLKQIDLQEIGAFIELLLDARNHGRMIFFIGNGGSAATASHFANDLAAGIPLKSKPFRAISLTDNVPVISALANDLSYEQIFERQLRAYAQNGDVLVAISASGNSPNLIAASQYAKSIGVRVAALTAFDGGQLRRIADLGVHVPTDFKEYGPAEDAHLVLDHLLNSYLSRLLSEERE